MSRQPPITDSPWLWFALFSGFGVLLLFLTGGKYGSRQSRLEQKAQAQIALAEGMEILEDPSGRKTAQGAPEYSKLGQPKIPLAPLVVTLGLMFVVCLAMFVREQSGIP
ncbi:MAG: hypothetical protein MK171_11235 [Pirellulales bacterium]|nr:hypothetical protein [Pirellulales bacterium]